MGSREKYTEGEVHDGNWLLVFRISGSLAAGSPGWEERLCRFPRLRGEVLQVPQAVRLYRFPRLWNSAGSPGWEVLQAVRKKWTWTFSKLGKVPHVVAVLVRNQACCQGQRGCMVCTELPDMAVGRDEHAENLKADNCSISGTKLGTSWVVLLWILTVTPMLYTQWAWNISDKLLLTL